MRRRLPAGCFFFAPYFKYFMGVKRAACASIEEQKQNAEGAEKGAEGAVAVSDSCSVLHGLLQNYVQRFLRATFWGCRDELRRLWRCGFLAC